VNGPLVTVIQGNRTIATNAVRCVYLTNNATMIGFTLANGGTRSTGTSLEQNGGGAWCERSNAVIIGCIFTNNTANSQGGGAFNGILNNCLLIGNSASSGGAVAVDLVVTAILNNCTIVSNSASTSGGGLASLGAGAPSYLLARNCIITDNSAPTGPNYAFGAPELTMDYCCTTPMPPVGSGNFTISPLFANPAAGNFHLQTNSPCINAGNNSYQTNSVDLDGNPRLVGNFVDIGAYEYQATAPVPLIPGVQASYTGVSTGVVVTFTGQIAGHPDSTRWDFKDGTVISNQLPIVTHSWNSPGDYDVALLGYDANHPTGVSASVTIHVLEHPVHYVAQAGTNPIPPYLTWDTAATKIQDAVDAAYINATVVVSNGTYSSGGRAITNIRYVLSLSNRVAVIKPITLQSLNGPSVTTIQGYQVPGTTNGASAIRCVYLTNNASLIGFTLTGGATLIYNGASSDPRAVQSGGVDCEAGASVSNCIITGNCAYIGGGGASGGTILNGILTSNWVAAGGGGGAYLATLNNCVVSGNSAGWGGGIDYCTANNCLLTGNNAAQGGGGAVDGTLNNCTVVYNLALVSGGGAYAAVLNNSIIYNNFAPEGTNYTLDTLSGGSLQSCCTTPLPPGYWNFTNAPIFIDEASGNFRLQTNSHCINAGNNLDAMGSVDLDGNPRIVGGTIDVGAYESQVYSSLISYAWLLQYGLPTDGSADALDPDGDGMNNWQEWIAGTVPTNAASVLRMLSPSKNASGLQLSWQSVIAKRYFLQRSTNLAAQPAFVTIQSNLFGQSNNITAFTDSGATNPTPYFYRVGVQ
jgi:hypothetical protein